MPTTPSVESNKVDWQRPLRMVPDVVADLSVDLGQVTGLLGRALSVRVREGQKKLSDYMLKSAGHVGIVRMPARDSDGSEDFHSGTWLSLKPSVAQSRLTPSARRSSAP